MVYCKFWFSIHEKTNHLFIKLIKILQVQITLNIYLHTVYPVKTNSYRQSLKSYLPLNTQKELSPIDTQINWTINWSTSLPLSLKSVNKKVSPEI